MHNERDCILNQLSLDLHSLTYHSSVLKHVLQVQDLAINLIFAGYDTCASSIHFLLRELFFNPQVLQRLREEQQQVGNAQM